MNRHQIRAIRHGLERDKIFSVGLGWNNDLIREPIMGKTIQDIKLCKPVKDFLCDPQYILTKGTNTYKIYSLDYNHTSQTFYVITKNDKIIYWTTSSIYAPASSAFHILTEVYHGYREDHAVYKWKSTEDFDCIDVFLTKVYNHKFNDHVKSNFEDMDYLHSDYQKKMWNETKQYYIDKIIVSKKELEGIADKLYYHL